MAVRNGVKKSATGNKCIATAVASVVAVKPPIWYRCGVTLERMKDDFSNDWRRQREHLCPGQTTSS